MSVGALLAFAPAAGLFHRAIPQSGASSTASTLTRATEVAAALLDIAGISANAATEELLALDPEKLVAAGTAASAQLANAMVFQPCIDGTLLTDLPINSVKNGSADGIQVMVGAARDEWRLFTAMPGFPSQMDDATLEQVLAPSIDDPAGVIAAYRAAREARGENADAGTLFAAIETDRIFRIPAIRLAEVLAERGQDAYQYLFTWESPWGDGALGSPHAIDIGFVFGTTGFSEGSAEFFGAGEDAENLTRNVQDAWLAFASTGDPRTEALADWTPYDTRRRETAIFDEPVAVADDPYGAERSVWTDLNVRIGGL
jgi:para-nitrobenzyl esterase